MMRRRQTTRWWISSLVAAALPAVLVGISARVAADPIAAPPNGPMEYLDDTRPSALMLSLRSEAAPTNVVLGPYTSVQVNVSAGGNNIVGDAANAPSLARQRST